MWLVLCHQYDQAALWAHQGLAARGLAPLVLLTDHTLAGSVRWDHHLGSDGAAVEIALPAGPTIRSGEVQGVLNRLTGAPVEQLLPLVAPDDRLYASQELSAFYLSWLQCLPGVVLNRPTPQGLCGRWRHASEWVYLAARAGLPVADYVQGGLTAPAAAEAGRLIPPGAVAHTVVVAGGRVTGAPAPPAIGAACLRLATLAGTAVLGVELVPTSVDAWTFAGASPLPDLRLGGAALLDALYQALRGEGGAGA